MKEPVCCPRPEVQSRNRSWARGGLQDSCAGRGWVCQNDAEKTIGLDGKSYPEGPPKIRIPSH